MSAVACAPTETVRHRDWDPVVAHAPKLSVTAWRYLDQMALSLRPATIDVADNTLRTFAGYLVAHHGEVVGFADVSRAEVEGFKKWFVHHPNHIGRQPARNTVRQRLGMLRSFFERIIEWDWDDAPARTPIFAIDVPVADDPLPRFLDDAQAARLRAAAAQADPLTHLVIEVLARTGMRVSEVCALQGDAVVQMGSGWWLRVPVGKLRNDRYVPLHPSCLQLLKAWAADHRPESDGLLITVDGRPLDRHQIARMVRRVARSAGLGNVHPHQLRHTLATQAINRGMRLEAIAAMLGHRSLRMTMVYARIANRTVADEYAAASAKVDALYGSDEPHLRTLEVEHRRMLANGWCNRPRGSDCAFEAVCEGCGYYQTTVEFLPTLRAQRDHAGDHGQPERRELFDRLINGLGEDIA